MGKNSEIQWTEATWITYLFVLIVFLMFVPMKHTDKSKKSLSEMRKGENNPFYGKKHSPETRKKLAANLKKYRENRTYDLKDCSISIPNENDLYYLAGMIDADGSIRFAKGRPFVAVYNVSKPLMDWIIKNIGGSITGKDKRGREISYQWKIMAAKDVYSLCICLLPILKIKQEDAKKAINHLKEKYGERI